MKLSKREKLALAAVAVVVVLFLFAQYGVTPFLERRDRLERSLAVKTDMLRQMRALSAEYESGRKASAAAKARFAAREGGFTLYSFLDRLSGKVGVKAKVAYMKPSSTADREGQFKVTKVEMKLKGVTLAQITSYLHLVETSKNMVFVRRLSLVKAGKRGDSIDATLLVETYEI
jgi:general secretion pathway protein M